MTRGKTTGADKAKDTSEGRQIGKTTSPSRQSPGEDAHRLRRHRAADPRAAIPARTTIRVVAGKEGFFY